jgi:hypothetical protein
MGTVVSRSSLGPVGHEGTRVTIAERPAITVSGWLGVLVLAVCAYGAYLANGHDPGLLWLPLLLIVLVATSLVVVPPGQTSVLQFFGRYVGTVRRPGFWWILPLTFRRKVSVRVRNFETNHLKVTDADGNPVEIAAIVVWQVADTAKSTYAVDSYENFVSVQSEAALRHVSNSHSYDRAGGSEPSLRGATDVVAEELAHEVAERVAIAGSRSWRSAFRTSPMRRRSRKRRSIASKPMPL